MVAAVSLDIETLSTHKNAVVLSIGACTVSLNDEQPKEFQALLDVQSQIDAGRHVSFDTLAFWMLQTDEAKAAVFRNDIERMPVKMALVTLRAWLGTFGNPPVWTKGPAFDGAVLESLAEDFNERSAWSYRLHRDLRVVEEFVQLLGSDAASDDYYHVVDKARAGRIAHNALEDARMQGAVVEWFIRKVST